MTGPIEETDVSSLATASGSGCGEMGESYGPHASISDRTR